MTMTYKPDTRNLMTVSFLFSLVVYVVLLVIFFVLPNYFNTVRIYDNLEQIPYLFLMVTLLSIGIFTLIFALSYIVARNLEAQINNTELTFILKPVIGSTKSFLIRLDGLLNITSRRLLIPAGKTFIVTYPLIFKNKDDVITEVPTFGWDNNTLKNILCDINKIKPEVKIDTVFYKGGELNNAKG